MKAKNVIIDSAGIASITLTSGEEFSLNICNPEFGEMWENKTPLDEYQREMMSGLLSDCGELIIWPQLKFHGKKSRPPYLSLWIQDLWFWSKYIDVSVPFNDTVLCLISELEEFCPECLKKRVLYAFTFTTDCILYEYSLILFEDGDSLFQIFLLTEDGESPFDHGGLKYFKVEPTDEHILLEEIKKNKFGKPDDYHVAELRKILESRLTIHSQYELE
ncbi:MAG: hypothetical protein QNL04_01580 [SAR324 cluster bacterium]|nr:hypothetical protein [SAR324 cluster bacterium]